MIVKDIPIVQETPDFYFINMNDGTLFTNRKQLQSASDYPLTHKEKVINILCEHILKESNQ